MLTAAITMASGMSAQDISGTILITKKLTKRSITPTISVYQRGTAVPLGKSANEDPLDFERSHVVVYLETSEASSPVNSAALKIQQLDRQFMPDLLVIPVGSTVMFPNMDPIFHNIFSLSKPKSFDLGSYNKGESRSATFPKPGIVSVYCHLHPNMEATIVVAPSRWYARSSGKGQFRIRDVPPGRYTVVAWHRSAGFSRKSIVVESGHNATVDFYIPLGSERLADTATSDPVRLGSHR